MAANRIKRLKDLVDRLERLPASPDRDRVLSEVRSRAVDVDTGVTPRAMLPLREPTPELVLPKRPVASRKPRTVPLPPASPIEVPRPAKDLPRPAKDLEPVLWADGQLSLDDSPLPHVRAQGGRDVRPWTRGLRA
jgi:hypothetical protein